MPATRCIFTRPANLEIAQPANGSFLSLMARSDSLLIYELLLSTLLNTLRFTSVDKRPVRWLYYVPPDAATRRACGRGGFVIRSKAQRSEP
jgi:hypothetical protein